MKDQRIKALPQKIKRTKKNKVKDLVEKEMGRFNIPRMGEFYVPPKYDPAIDSETKCLRPDIYLDNDRHCDGCRYYKICRSACKTLPKHIMFDGEKFVYSDERKTKRTRK